MKKKKRKKVNLLQEEKKKNKEKKLRYASTGNQTRPTDSESEVLATLPSRGLK